MHELQVGDKIGVRGPYGTSFPVSEEKLSGRDLLFVAGGIGLVPLRSAILQAFDQADQYNSITILFGCRQPSERLFVEEFSHWRSTPKVKFLETVDRADSSWTGNTGVITTLFPEIEINPENTVALICGPPIMYKFVITELFSRYLPPDQIYVSLERRMKCGIGKCGHCQINDWYTCLEGPVFQFTQLATVPEAFK
jgi:NAD(P)H-flavin reductase